MYGYPLHSEDSYGCVFETEDSEAHRGVRLSKGTYVRMYVCPDGISFLF